jgi:hypothetical protein
MTRWEYAEMVVHSPEDIVRKLQSVGEVGWEVCAITYPNDRYTAHVFMKRAVPQRGETGKDGNG